MMISLRIYIKHKKCDKFIRPIGNNIKCNHYYPDVRLLKLTSY